MNEDLSLFSAANDEEVEREVMNEQLQKSMSELMALMLFAWHDGMWMRRTWEQLCMRVFKSKANRLRNLYDRFYGLVKELIG